MQPSTQTPPLPTIPPTPRRNWKSIADTLLVLNLCTVILPGLGLLVIGALYLIDKSTLAWSQWIALPLGLALYIGVLTLGVTSFYAGYYLATMHPVGQARRRAIFALVGSLLPLAVGIGYLLAG